MNLKTNLARSNIEQLLSQHYEAELIKELRRVFNEMGKRVIHELEEYYHPGDLATTTLVDLILSPIHELHHEYYTVLSRYTLREYDKSHNSAIRITRHARKLQELKDNQNKKSINFKSEIVTIPELNLTPDKENLFQTLTTTEQDLMNRTYKFTESTLKRIDQDIHQIIKKGYIEGKGINNVRDSIQKRFNELKTWEAQRIARTEINTSHNMGIIQGYQDMNVEYIQWNTTQDERTRTSHQEIDGEIIPIGSTFSNNLHHPGDPNGAAAEVINCRCVASPYIMPYNKMAPKGMSRFREDDLVTISTPQIGTTIAEGTPKIIENHPLINDSPGKLSFEELKTPQEIADYYGLEYSHTKFPQISTEAKRIKGADGLRYKIESPNRGNHHKFYDRENDCAIYIHDSLCKPSRSKKNMGELLIDINNEDKGLYNLRDIIKIYDEAPTVLKKSNTSITFTNRISKQTYAYNMSHYPDIQKNLSADSLYKKEITRGHPPRWVDVFKNHLTTDDQTGYSLQRGLYHEMAHGLDAALSTTRKRQGRFSNQIGYASRVYPQRNYNEATHKLEKTDKSLADGLSSEYGQRHFDKRTEYSEDFADAISMVAFKNIEDKTGATILPPEWTPRNKAPALTYEEWIKKYPHKKKFLEEVLGI